MSVEKITTGPDQKPFSYGPYDTWERMWDPWHEDAFPTEFKATAPRKGPREEGWALIDGVGNPIGFVLDGTEMERNKP